MTLPFLLKTFKIGDLIILVVIIAFTAWSVYNTYFIPHNSLQVLITSGEDRFLYPLETRESIEVTGPLGITLVHIEGGKVWIESSPCTNQLCVLSGHVGYNGAVLACLPNNVLVAIQGNNTETFTNDSFDVMAG